MTVVVTFCGADGGYATTIQTMRKIQSIFKVYAKGIGSLAT